MKHKCSIEFPLINGTSDIIFCSLKFFLDNFISSIEKKIQCCHDRYYLYKHFELESKNSFLSLIFTFKNQTNQ